MDTTALSGLIESADAALDNAVTYHDDTNERQEGDWTFCGAQETGCPECQINRARRDLWKALDMLDPAYVPPTKEAR